MSRYLIRLLFSCFLICLSTGAFSQTEKELQLRQKKLRDEINYTNTLLQETKKSKNSSLDHIVMLNTKIGSREEIIATINAQIRLLDKQIEGKRVIVEALEKDLEELKEEYAKMIYYSYKNRSSYNRLMFIFSAKNFNEAYKRLKYLQQYAAYRKRQADLITKTKNSIASELADLESKKESKKQLLYSKRSERNKLTGEKKQKERVVVELKQKEKELLKDLKRKQRSAQKLQKAIEEEIRKAREAAERLKNPGKKGFPMTPEAQKLSASFSANKGKLPWPVEQGVITGRFGEHAHPLFPNILVNNNGIDISTGERSTARAVFEGKVSQVVIIPGSGKGVFVRHGEYLTVYANLASVDVKKGDVVSTKQSIGTLISDKANAKSEIHFELWKGKNKLNPAYWLYKR